VIAGVYLCVVGNQTLIGFQQLVSRLGSSCLCPISGRNGSALRKSLERIAFWSQKVSPQFPGLSRM